MDGPHLLGARREIGTGYILCGMRKIIALVAFRGDNDRALLHGEPDGPLLRLPDRPLLGVVLAVEQERIGKVAVVCDIDMVRTGPDERANNRLREEVAVRVACLDR